MEEQEKIISNKEYKVVSQSLFELLSKCNVLPEDTLLKFQSVAAEKSMGFFTLPGAKYLERHIDGSFTAQLAFQIVYKTKAAGNGQMLDAQTTLDNVCNRLEEAEFPVLSDNRIIQEIVIDSTPYVTDKDDTGYVEYVRTGTLKYEKGE